MKTTGAATKLVLAADRTVIHADGQDLAFVTVRVADNEGRTVPTANDLIRFAAGEPGAIVAVGNGDPTDHTSFHSDRYRAFHGQCLVIVRSREGNRGAIRVTAESESLTGGSTVIDSQ